MRSNYRFLFCSAAVLVGAVAAGPGLSAAGPPRHRLVVLADMGNEPDEEQQIVHLLACCNEFDVRALIAVTGKYLRETMKEEYKQKLHPELFHRLIDGYAQVLPNLRRHAGGWPEADFLHSVVSEGQPRYGTAAVGAGKTSPGSEAIRKILLDDDPRPVWVVVNAGANTLAQALWDLRERSRPDELTAAVAKLRVFENGAQDNAGAWICHEFPAVHWIRSNYQTYAYGGPGENLGPHHWKPFPYTAAGQHQWLKEHVQTGHGALGALYPDRRVGNRLHWMEGGGTVPWLGLVGKGLFDIDQPSWGGWAGRFTATKATNVWSRHADIRQDERQVVPFAAYREVGDVWTDPEGGETFHGDFVPVWRWRAAMYADFRCRMDWCVKPVGEANHHPVAAFNGDAGGTVVRLKSPAGAAVELDASASTDPDGDPLVYSWWQYQEAGTYPGRVVVEAADAAKAKVYLPTGAVGKQVHVVLEVRDKSPVVPLHAYRRVVIDVGEDAAEPGPRRK